MRLFVVFVAYGSGRNPRTHHYLDALAARYRPSRLVVVDNSHDLQAWRHSPFMAIAGDNRLREFSGWDAGVRMLAATDAPAPDDRLLFINDTVCRQAYLRWLTLRHAHARVCNRAAHPGAAVCGPIERSPFGTVHAFGGALEDYIATCFFSMPMSIYQRLGALAVELPWVDWLGGDWPALLFRLPGEHRYNRFYNAWLGCGEPEGVGRWPGSRERPFTAENHAFLRDKARCILLESALSARLACLHGPGRWACDIHPSEPWRRWLKAVFALGDSPRLERSVQ